MSQNSKIEWTDDTFNPWWGCTKVKIPGESKSACDFCYAESFSKRLGQKVWGSTAPRRFFSTKHWDEPRKWNEKAFMDQRRKRVFCGSMCDIFEDYHGPTRDQLERAREDLWDLIEECTYLDWQLLTKRPEDVMAMVPDHWEEWPKHVWMGATVEHQPAADVRIPELFKIPAAVRFISYEPALGPLDLDKFLRCESCGYTHADAQNHMDHALCGKPTPPQLHWAIAGGESGVGARPLHPDWFRSFRDQCAAAGVPFFFKQWGEWALGAEHGFLGHPRAKEHVWSHGDGTGTLMLRVGKKAAGRLLDGREHNEFPQQNL